MDRPARFLPPRPRGGGALSAWSSIGLTADEEDGGLIHELGAFLATPRRDPSSLIGSRGSTPLLSPLTSGIMGSRIDLPVSCDVDQVPTRCAARPSSRASRRRGDPNPSPGHLISWPRVQVPHGLRGPNRREPSGHPGKGLPASSAMLFRRSGGRSEPLCRPIAAYGYGGCVSIARL